MLFDTHLHLIYPDILKPYPISYFDKKLKNGFGIVLDDCIAGIFSGIGATFITILLI